MRNSAVDNPTFLAVTINTFLGRWEDRKGGRSYAEATPLVVDEGQHLVHLHCAACHTLGHGDRIGPDLLGVTTRRDRAWLARFIQRPDQVLAAGDPVATELFARHKQVQMPNLRLGEVDVAALLKYLEAQTAARQNSEGTQAVDPGASEEEGLSGGH
jgi:protein SCO1/2